MTDHQEGLWFIDPAHVITCETDKYSPKVSIRAIQKQVCQEYGITLADMLSPIRAKKYAIPRHIAMHRCAKMRKWSYPQIGRAFDRHYSVVIHAERVIDKDPDYLARLHRKKVYQACKTRTNMVQLSVG